MGWTAGVDLGTTWLAVAAEHDGRADLVVLGDRAPVIPAIVARDGDGDGRGWLVGEPARRVGAVTPGSAASHVKRRLGDDVPLILDGSPHPPEELLAVQLLHVLRRATERMGAAPDHVTVTHPAAWGPHRRARLAALAETSGLPLSLASEPEAAAVYHAAAVRPGAGEADVNEPGATIAVYDWGGGTFDATILRRTRHGHEVLGTPVGIDPLGGLDVDDILLGIVLGGAGIDLATIDPEDAVAVADAHRLRVDVVDAKEALSAATSTSVPVRMGAVATEVRVTRVEFEQAVGPLVDRTVEGLVVAIEGAGLGRAGIDAVLLVGGSSRIPFVAQRVGAALSVPVSMAGHPKHPVALGGAILARREVAAPDPTASFDPRTTTVVSLEPVSPDPILGHPGSPAPASPGLEVTTAPAPTVGVEQPHPTVFAPPVPGRGGRSPGPSRRWPVVVAAAGVAVVALAALWQFVVSPELGFGGDDGTDTASAPADRAIAFVEDLAAAASRGDDERLFGALHPLVIARYGASQCRARLADASLADGLQLRPERARPASGWVWTADGARVPVTDALAVDAIRPDGSSLTMHVAPTGSGLGWFTDCGDPRPPGARAVDPSGSSGRPGRGP